MYTTSIRKSVVCTLLVLAALACAGCEKLGGGTESPKLPAIPASVGELVAVSQGDAPYQSVLWFKQPDQTIVAVRVNFLRGTIEARMTKFPRS